MEVKFGALPKDPNSILPFLRNTVQAVRDALRTLAAEKRDVSSVTGSLNIVTGLQRVDHVQANLSSDPVVGACFVAARPTGTPGEILLVVKDNTGAASLIATNVSWIAYGI
jgi:hypothetical protein